MPAEYLADERMLITIADVLRLHADHIDKQTKEPKSSRARGR